VSKMMFTLALCTHIAFFAVNGFAFSPASTFSGKGESLADLQLENVRIQSQGITSLLSKLARDYDIPVGLEIASNENQFDIYFIDFEKGTLSDLLNQFVNQYDRYTWEIQDNVVNVFPKGGSRDIRLDIILRAEIDSFSIKENTGCFQLADSLIATPEMKNVLESMDITPRGPNFSGFYFPQLGRQFTLNVSHITLRSILNRVIKESPIAKIWHIELGNSDRMLSMRFSARQEDANRQWKFDVPDMSP
jgi:hypothetical protein